MKKKQLRPWLLQFQWKSSEDFKIYSFRATNSFYDDKWYGGGSMFINSEKAKRGLEKLFLDEIGNMRFKGRNWRIIDKETKQILSVIIENKTIILK